MSDQLVAVVEDAKPAKPTGRFQPGNCANPGGRPKVVADIRDLARQYSTAAMTALVDVATNPKSPPAARVAASAALLDRGYGRPMQPTVVHKSPIEGLDEQELQLVIEALEAADPRAEAKH